LHIKRDQVKAVNYEDYLKEQRNGGKPPEYRPSLWDSFNDFVTQSTYGIRRKARNVLKKRLENSSYSKEAKEQLYKKTNHIVDGGVSGLAHAVHTLLTR
jgi:hypothetical protein